MRTPSRVIARAAAWLCCIAFLFLWEWAVNLHFLSPASFAAPSEIAVALPRLFSLHGGLLDVASTLGFTILAFWASIPVGIGAGAIAYYFLPYSRPLAVAIDFLRSVPGTALVPVFLMVVGINDRTKVSAGLFSSSLVISLATLRGLHGLNRTRQSVAICLRLPLLRRIALVDLPEASAAIFLGCRTGLSLALILIVVTEMLVGANRGLGRLIADNRYTDDKALMYAAILCTGLIGFLLNLGLERIEQAVLHWRGR